MSKCRCQNSDSRDIDLHRYECVSCGKIGYYNIAARNYFEHGGADPEDGWNYLNNGKPEQYSNKKNKP